MSNENEPTGIERLINKGKPMNEWQKRFTMLGLVVVVLMFFFFLDNNQQRIEPAGTPTSTQE